MSAAFLKLYRVYIDESGDRGLSSARSKVFILAAVVAKDSDELRLRATRDHLCASLGKPTDTVLHWSANVKGHSARKEVASVLGALPLTLCYAIVDKQSFQGTPTGLADSGRVYNYAARRLLERISWLMRDSGGAAYVTFAHVKNFKYAPFRGYLARLRADTGCAIHWPSILGTPRIDQPQAKVLLQVADVAAGALAAAVVDDPYGRIEYVYLSLLESRIYRRPPGSILTYGLHVIGMGPKSANCVTRLPWWGNFPNK